MRDPRDHCSWACFHFGRCEPHYAHTVGKKPRVACQVVLDLLELFVPGTVDLHAQLCRCAIEVQDIWPDRVLPAKAKSVLVSPKHAPKRSLRCRHLRP